MKTKSLIICTQILLMGLGSLAKAEVQLPSSGQQLVCDYVYKFNTTVIQHGPILAAKSGKLIELIDGHNVALSVKINSTDQVQLSGQNGFVDTNSVSLSLNADGTGEITYDDFTPGLSNNMDFLLSNCSNQ